MRFMDFDPLSRTSIGFDRLFNMLEDATQIEHPENYPPYNIERVGQHAYRITIAVAGFSQDELSITTQPDQLVVAGKKARNGQGHYLYQGIAGRAFVRQFSLADTVKVTGASLEHGMLSIDLVHEIPEAMKPRRIEITSGKQDSVNQQIPNQIEGKVAA